MDGLLILGLYLVYVFITARWTANMPSWKWTTRLILWGVPIVFGLMTGVVYPDYNSSRYNPKR